MSLATLGSVKALMLYTPDRDESFDKLPSFTPMGGGERRHCHRDHSCLKAWKDTVRAAVESAERN